MSNVNRENVFFTIGPIWKDEEEWWREQKFLKQKELKGKLKQTFILC